MSKTNRKATHLTHTHKILVPAKLVIRSVVSSLQIWAHFRPNISANDIKIPSYAKTHSAPHKSPLRPSLSTRPVRAPDPSSPIGPQNGAPHNTAGRHQRRHLGAIRSPAEPVDARENNNHHQHHHPAGMRAAHRCVEPPSHRSSWPRLHHDGVAAKTLSPRSTHPNRRPLGPALSRRPAAALLSPGRSLPVVRRLPARCA